MSQSGTSWDGFAAWHEIGGANTKIAMKERTLIEQELGNRFLNLALVEGAHCHWGTNPRHSPLHNWCNLLDLHHQLIELLGI